jgi:predicted nucleic acid-binding protein
MSKVFLDSPALVELHFRQQKHEENCRKHLPEGIPVVASAYVVFELARGFLTRLRKLHDESFACTDELSLRELAEKQRMGKRRQSDTWTDVMNDDLWRLKRLRGSARREWEQPQS